MQVSVTAVEHKRGLNEFILFPLRHYHRDSFFVPHLLYERKKFFSPSNPLFEYTDITFFLARNGQGRVVGRVTAHVNRRHNEYAGEKTGFFGFFECIDDRTVASALMTAVENKLRDAGMNVVRGPFNFSTNEECGFLVQGFDRPPALMMPYTKPSYVDFMAQLDYRRAKDLLAYEYAHEGRVPDFLVRFSKRIRDRSRITVRTINMRRFEEDVATIFDIYNAAWSKNWGFIPVTEDELRYAAEELRPVVDPSMVLIAEKAGRPVAFSVSLPDYNVVLKKMHGRLLPFGFLYYLFGRKAIKSVRTLLLGVVEEYRKSGLEVLLIHDTFRNAVSRGYRAGEMSWILENNVLMRRPLERMGAELTKVYRIYEKEL
jgi:GNAT superfamily N-acetyltransferase